MSTSFNPAEGAGIVCSAHPAQKSIISGVSLLTPNILENDDAAK